MNRRVSILVDRLSRLIPETQPLQGLDVGCGSGEVAYWLTQNRSNISLQGVDILVRSQTHIPVQQFDGLTLPFADNSVDFIMLVALVCWADGVADGRHTSKNIQVSGSSAITSGGIRW